MHAMVCDLRLQAVSMASSLEIFIRISPPASILSETCQLPGTALRQLWSLLVETEYMLTSSLDGQDMLACQLQITASI